MKPVNMGRQLYKWRQGKHFEFFYIYINGEWGLSNQKCTWCVPVSAVSLWSDHAGTPSFIRVSGAFCMVFSIRMFFLLVSMLLEWEDRRQKYHHHHLCLSLSFTLLPLDYWSFPVAAELTVQSHAVGIFHILCWRTEGISRWFHCIESIADSGERESQAVFDNPVSLC